MNTNDSSDKSEFVDNLNIFRNIDFFSGVSIEVMKLFAYLCQRQMYMKDDVIFNQDDDDGKAYYVLSGKTKLIFNSKGKDLLIREFNNDNYFGILSLMTPMVKQFSLIATEDTTCVVMTRKAFSKVVDQFPETPLKIVKTIGQRVLQTERKILMEYETSKNEDIKKLLGISLI